MARASMIAVMALCLRDAHGAGASADLVSFVNPFLGTEKGALDYGLNNGAGDTFPGPVFPFGMVQWSPIHAPGRRISIFAGNHSRIQRHPL